MKYKLHAYPLQQRECCAFNKILIGTLKSVAITGKKEQPSRRLCEEKSPS
jgi:hypothetical protein